MSAGLTHSWFIEDDGEVTQGIARELGEALAERRGWRVVAVKRAEQWVPGVDGWLVDFAKEGAQ